MFICQFINIKDTYGRFSFFSLVEGIIIDVFCFATVSFYYIDYRCRKDQWLVKHDVLQCQPGIMI